VVQQGAFCASFASFAYFADKNVAPRNQQCDSLSSLAAISARLAGLDTGPSYRRLFQRREACKDDCRDDKRE
jgi:hypothetical protein